MGHIINHYTEKFKNEKQAMAFIGRCTKCAYDPNETSAYHGNMTCHFKKVYQDYKYAEEAIREYDNGWYSDHAVLYQEPSQKARDKSQGLLEKRDAYIEAHSVHKRKSDFLGCSTCGSKISRLYLKGEKCPVCGTDLRPTSVIEQIKKHDKQAKEALKSDMETWILVKVEYHH